jgi:hypothetical protein
MYRIYFCDSAGVASADAAIAGVAGAIAEDVAPIRPESTTDFCDFAMRTARLKQVIAKIIETALVIVLVKVAPPVAPKTEFEEDCPENIPPPLESCIKTRTIRPIHAKIWIVVKKVIIETP